MSLPRPAKPSRRREAREFMTNVIASNIIESIPPLKQVRDFFCERGVPAYLVGGSVRDHRLGRVTRDVDVAVGGDALRFGEELTSALGGHFVLMDEEHQIARVVVKSGDWHVDLSTVADTIESDLARRDFTVDAMAIDLAAADGEIIDPFGGRRDLDLHVIRAVTEAALEEDPLRLMRAVRLAAELDFEIESQTEQWVRAHAALILGIAPERIRDELYRTISAPHTACWLLIMDDLGLLTTVLPELKPARGAQQPKEHHWDVFRHSVETVAALEFLTKRGAPGGLWQSGRELLEYVPWSPEIEAHFNGATSAGRNRSGLLRLIGLLHDVAKPACKTIEQSGRMRFFGHPEEGARMATAILERLRFSAREVEIACEAVKNHLRPGTWGERQPTDSAIYRFFRDTKETGIDVIFLNLADHLAARGPSLSIPEWEEHGRAAAYVLNKYFQEKSVVAPPKLVDGYLLMEHFNLEPGPRIGYLLEAIREAQASGQVKTRDEALEFAAKLLSQGGTAGQAESVACEALVLHNVLTIKVT